MTVTASTLIDPESAPSDKNELWQPPVFFLHHWEEGCEVETSWRTMVTQSRSNKEQRFSLMEKPRRVMTARGLGWNCRERGQQLLRNNLQRLGDARQPFPLYPDRVKVTPKGAAFNNIYVVEEDLDTRRYFVGARVLAANIENAHPQYVDDFLIRKITAVDHVNNEITLDGDLGETYRGEITIDDESFGFDGSSTSVDTNFDMEVTSTDQIIIVQANATPIGGGIVTGWGTPTWNEGAGENFTLERSATVVDPGSSQNHWQGLWYLRPSTTGNATVTVSVTATKSAAIALQCHVLGGASLSGNPFQGSNDREGFASTIGFPPLNVATTVDRPSDNTYDFVFAAQHVTVGAPSQSSRMDMVVPTGWTTLREGAMGGGHYGFYRRFFGDQVAGDPASVTARWTWNGIDLPLAGDRMQVVVGSIDAEVNILDNPAKRFMWPLIEGNLSLRHQSDAITDDVTEANLTVQETAGPSGLDPIRDPNTVNAAWPTHTEDSGFTFPIFDYFTDWTDTDIRFIRPGRANTIGTGVAFDVYGNRPLAEIDANFTGLHRDNVWDLMEFFDSRAGRTFPFWYVSPTADYEFVSNNGSTRLDVTAAGAEEDWNLHPFIAVVMKDGTYYIRRISSTTRALTVDQITLSSSISTVLDVNDIKRVTVAYLCRFATDSFTEKWTTDEVQEVSLKIHELDYDLETTDKSLSLDIICPGGSGSSPWTPDGEDICDERCCGTACNVCLDEFYAVELTCWCYNQSTGEDCENPCDGLVTDSVSLTIVLAPVSCISSVARWENGDAWVTLDLDGPDWSWDLGSYDCCAGLQVFTACICAFVATDDCSPSLVITESCTSYLKETVTDITCNLNPALRITCTACATGAC